MGKLIALIKELASNKYYGKITIDFQNGKPIRYVKEESGKL
jgi:hypothetical protein